MPYDNRGKGVGVIQPGHLFHARIKHSFFYVVCKNQFVHRYTYWQIASRHSSIVSRCAFVRERPLDNLYIV